MKITLLWNPYSTNNIYSRNWSKGFIKPKPKQQKDYYILQAKQQIKQKLKWEIKLEVKIYFWDRRKRDIDNYNKLWMDALSWVLYEDDKQVTDLRLIKDYDKDNPRIVINVK